MKLNDYIQKLVTNVTESISRWHKVENATVILTQLLDEVF